MEEPTEKRLDPALSPLFVGTVHDKLREYDGMRVGDARPCPACGSTDLRKNGYQRTAKTFARLITDDGFEEIGLEVQQYECKDCNRSFQGDLSEHFYEGCGYAKPIVDLAVCYAAEYSYNRTERLLGRIYGLQVDRDTIKRYADRFDGSEQGTQWVTIRDHRVSLSFLAFLFDGDDSWPFVISSPRALW